MITPVNIDPEVCFAKPAGADCAGAVRRQSRQRVPPVTAAALVTLSYIRTRRMAVRHFAHLARLREPDCAGFQGRITRQGGPKAVPSRGSCVLLSQRFV